jgi:hypothetical protein
MKGRNNFEPMNFLSPQGQIIPFIKVLIKYVVAFKIYFYQRSRATPLGEPSMTAREVVVWEEAHSSTSSTELIFCLWRVEARVARRKTTIFLLTLGTSDARVECRGRMNSPLS